MRKATSRQCWAAAQQDMKNGDLRAAAQNIWGALMLHKGPGRGISMFVKSIVIDDYPTACVNLQTGCVRLGEQFLAKWVHDVEDVVWLCLHEQGHVVLREVYGRTGAMTPLINFVQDAYINSTTKRLTASDLPERFYENKDDECILLTRNWKGIEQYLNSQGITDAYEVARALRKAGTDTKGLDFDYWERLITPIVKQLQPKLPEDALGGMGGSDSGESEPEPDGGEGSDSGDGEPEDGDSGEGSGNGEAEEEDDEPEDEEEDSNGGEGDDEEDEDEDNEDSNGGEDEAEEEDDEDEGSSGSGEGDESGEGENGGEDEDGTCDSGGHSDEDVADSTYQDIMESNDYRMSRAKLRRLLDLQAMGQDLSKSERDNEQVNVQDLDDPLPQAQNVVKKMLIAESLAKVIHGSDMLPPDVISSKDLTLLGAGHIPTSWDVTLTPPQKQWVAYVDVSPSTSKYWPPIVEISRQVRHLVKKLYQFGSVLREVPKGAENTVIKTCGTNFKRVADSILKNREQNVIVATDNLPGDYITAAQKRMLKMRRVNIILVLVGNDDEINTKGEWVDVASKVLSGVVENKDEC